MKKIISIIVVLLLFVSCEKQGTLKESQATQKEPCIIGKDTIDLYIYWPNTVSNIWIAKVRNSNPPVVSLTYPQGKTYESVIILDHINDVLVKKQRVINGSVISENDSIIVIKKKK